MKKRGRRVRDRPGAERGEKGREKEEEEEEEKEEEERGNERTGKRYRSRVVPARDGKTGPKSIKPKDYAYEQKDFYTCPCFFSVDVGVARDQYLLEVYPFQLCSCF